MYVLLVEDEDPKRDLILAFLARVLPEAEIATARSVRSAVASLRTRTPDLLLLDMSLPTFDQSPTEPGGRPQGFGGIEVMRNMDRYEILAPVIVVTAYEAFSQDGRSVANTELSNELAQEHPEVFRGLVYFNTVFGDWDRALEEAIDAALPNAIRS